MSQLFSPFSIGPLNLENRIIIAPMCQYSAVNGSASDWHLIHLGHLAQSGAGLLIIEATAVNAEGRISPEDLGIWNHDNEVALQKIVMAIRQYSAMPIGMQLAHAGRKASTLAPWLGGNFIPPTQGGWQTVAPSAQPYNPDEPAPIALNATGMEKIKQDFVAAAERAHRIGLDIIELHAAHGYLLHQFLSPLANSRTDHYGGSLENRMRFPLEVFKAIKDSLPSHIPIGIRISASDWVTGGWDIAQSLEFCHALRALGCSYIHVSSGGLSPLQKIPVGKNYQVPFAEQILKETGLPTIAVGLITEPQQAEAIIAEGRADMVALARAMLYNPRWPWHAAAELGAQVHAPKQYWRSQPHGLENLFYRD